MLIPITLSVHNSERFSSKKDGRFYVKITGTGSGLGLFQFIVPEERIPDSLEGKVIKANFKLYIGRDFSVRFCFDSIDHYVG